MKTKRIFCVFLCVLILGLVRQVAWVNLDGDVAKEMVILTRNHHLFVWDGANVAQRSITNLKPWKLAFGDINDDGIAEIAIGVFKSTPMHHTVSRRAFFYALRSGEIVPVLRMSRTYQPLVDFYITDHLVTIEFDQTHYYSVHYTWSGFGFEIAHREGPFLSAAEALQDP